ncbi:DNA gyrase inhibitor YacG (plasmid) [Azospirillum humicireducens]|uniref:DNA gyrase inhibitor YacG n=1 Tax=Azospirillum humicireducens TaxID=1226968 RepID=A0A2R4VV28_9PROT|nr:DNA gyrase inhibitor YacG [Azospirillum humicireducens]AWB08308.1 DNA gyrase inhibitor YacG [Azospirillum humicireducens]
MSDPQSPGAGQRAHSHAQSHAGAKAGAGTQCPICGRPTEPATRPFCSKRCADIDLSRWLGEGYRIPGSEAPVPTRDSDPDDGL